MYNLGKAVLNSKTQDCSSIIAFDKIHSFFSMYAAFVEPCRTL